MTDLSRLSPTAIIQAYRRREIPFNAVVYELAKREYADPSWAEEEKNMTAAERRLEAEVADRFEAGTWGEIDGLWASKLLTDDEYLVISGVWDQVHGVAGNQS